ncbi:hypothetical protein [Novosphingobium sp.]|uniref:hypothetical protein n=1 Tax=Novosphingobium sp. TaxID=1874826 RepID=UPI001ECE798D|nr:hypothetical protein [Novosphingobium sp.]MBK6802464.1 hypothetical protein [Novosphingobium sp.]MBK9009476.1 hypothetical protein [Novosphingobium sp.]
MGLMQFFSRRKTRKHGVQAGVPTSSHKLRQELLDAAKVGISGILGPQLALLGMEFGEVPLEEDDVGRRSCGYVLGMVQGVLSEFAQLQPSQDEFVYLLATGFAAVHGPFDGQVGLQTIYLQELGEQHVLEGVKLATRDVRAVYSGEAFAMPNGLFLIHNDDATTLRQNLAAMAAQEG